jgi:hypothetical protein
LSLDVQIVIDRKKKFFVGQFSPSTLLSLQLFRYNYTIRSKESIFITSDKMYFQVFYGGTSGDDCVYLFWVVDGKVQLTWIKYQMPINSNYQLVDACLCPGMSKLVAGTNRGRLLLFDASVRGLNIDAKLPVNEHIETKLIVKVAHEVENHVLYSELLLFYTVAFA